MREPLILNKIKEYADSNAVRFHMPGHKGQADFCRLFPMAGEDITELSFSGCLESGEGVVRQAEENLAEILGATSSHMVTDGSSCAVLSMMYAASKFGNKIIIPRISHKSVYNSLKLFGLEPLFMECEEKDGIVLQNVSSIAGLLKVDGVAGVMLTSPDYYGLMPDLALAKSLCRQAGKLLFVDGAHGGHLKFCNEEIYAGTYADAWVDGVHKTLPCLTQSAVLNVNNKALLQYIEEGLGLFRTTSPSYPIMASIEYGVYYGEAEGRSGFGKLFTLLDITAKRLEVLGYAFVKTDDRAKFVLDCKASNVNCQDLVAYLEGDGIFVELADGRYIVMMASLMTGEKDIERLTCALAKYAKLGAKATQNTQKPHILEAKPIRQMGYLQAVNADCEYVSSSEAIGRASAENCGFFPPCYPIITAGEVFTEEITLALSGADNAFGLKGGRFKVVKG